MTQEPQSIETSETIENQRQSLKTHGMHPKDQRHTKCMRCKPIHSEQMTAVKFSDLLRRHAMMTLKNASHDEMKPAASELWLADAFHSVIEPLE